MFLSLLGVDEILKEYPDILMELDIFEISLKKVILKYKLLEKFKYL